MIRIIRALLLLLATSGSAQANPYAFSVACTFAGGTTTFVASGDYTARTAVISWQDGSVVHAFVTPRYDTMPKPTLALLVRGKTKAGSLWRDLYLVETGQGTFTQVNEIWADGPDRDPSMTVQGGSCRSTKP
jgi:hypothetical protein